MGGGPPLWVTIVAVGVAAYGALLSTLLAFYQGRRDRRRLRIKAGSLLILESDPEAVYEVLWVRAVKDGHRPIDVRQAGVMTEAGSLYHPRTVTPKHEKRLAPAVVQDGEGVAFHFDIRSFEDEGYMPKRVWVEDFVGHRYYKRISRKGCSELRALLASAHQRDAKRTENDAAADSS